VVKQRNSVPRGRIVKNKQHLKKVAIAVILASVGLVVYTLVAGYTYQAKQKVELQNSLHQLQVEKVKSTEDKKKIEELTKQLQAKREAATALAEAQAQEQKAAVTRVQAPIAYSGSHSDWMSAAGIPSDQWAAAEALVQRESSWNPSAYNSIGACSLVQALPCSKIPGDWRDPVTALRWGSGYVVARYGSWNNALAHSYAFNWY
jgi:hypothetical protein